MIATTAGVAAGLGDLLALPGASHTLLEAIVPYVKNSLNEWLTSEPEQSCSQATALSMATVAFQRARQLAPDQSVERLVGIGCTAALVSQRPKRGAHRCFVAAQTADATRLHAVIFEKDARDRAAEDRLVGQLILQTLAEVCGIDDVPSLDLSDNDQIKSASAQAELLLSDVWNGDSQLVWSMPDGDLRAKLAVSPTGLLCGSFNPLHHGHHALRKVAEQLLGGSVYVELSIFNVDKPPLDYLTLGARRRQFTEHPLALTNAATFAEKAALFPQTTFVVGFDTAERIVQPRFYDADERLMREALQKLTDAGCRFLVAGRLVGDRFQSLQEIVLPDGFERLFQEIPASQFREDICSTKLRHKPDGGTGNE